MTRLCGATQQRTAREQRACWCAGLFCGRGGARLTAQFQQSTRTTVTAPNRDGFAELLRQLDLFDGDAERARWLEILGSRGRQCPRCELLIYPLAFGRKLPSGDGAVRLWSCSNGHEHIELVTSARKRKRAIEPASTAV